MIEVRDFRCNSGIRTISIKSFMGMVKRMAVGRIMTAKMNWEDYSNLPEKTQEVLNLLGFRPGQ